MPPPRATAALALVAAALAVTVSGCHGPRARAAARRPPEMLVEVLPRSAWVELDGRPIGAGGGAVASPSTSDEHVLRVSADGYEPEERVLPAGSLDGARIAAALQPLGFGAARAIDYDDAPALAAAAEWLTRFGDPRDAAEYAERAIAVDPMLAAAHRSLGDARRRAGDEEGAVAAWAEYLRRAPDASDAAEVERRMEAMRRDVRIP
jgi:tetratricopeptide (TPR) repeat protein